MIYSTKCWACQGALTHSLILGRHLSRVSTSRTYQARYGCSSFSAAVPRKVCRGIELNRAVCLVPLTLIQSHTSGKFSFLGRHAWTLRGCKSKRQRCITAVFFPSYSSYQAYQYASRILILMLKWQDSSIDVIQFHLANPLAFPDPSS